jgi:hypothetical protein
MALNRDRTHATGPANFGSRELDGPQKVSGTACVRGFDCGDRPGDRASLENDEDLAEDGPGVPPVASARAATQPPVIDPFAALIRARLSPIVRKASLSVRLRARP